MRLMCPLEKVASTLTPLICSFLSWVIKLSLLLRRQMLLRDIGRIWCKWFANQAERFKRREPEPLHFLCFLLPNKNGKWIVDIFEGKCIQTFTFATKVISHLHSVFAPQMIKSWQHENRISMVWSYISCLFLSYISLF